MLADDRIGVDHTKVDACDPLGVHGMPFDRNRGGDGQPQLTAFCEQGDRSDLFGRVGQGPGHPHPQGRAALATGSRTRRRPSSWNVPLWNLTGTSARFLWGNAAGLPLLRRLEPGGRVAPRHRSRADRRELAEAAPAGKFPAQRLVADQRSRLVGRSVDT